jgi:Derlin-2/3
MWPQVWRPLTAFLITKPKFGILLDPYFCYQYGSGLERESARFSAPGDFAVYTAFVGGIIAVSDAVFFLELVLSVPLRFLVAWTHQSATQSHLGISARAA